MAESGTGAASAVTAGTQGDAGSQDNTGSNEKTGLMAKASAGLDGLDDNLPPSLRTKKMVAKHLGANSAARGACMAIIAGEPLTRHQTRAMFRLARTEKVDDAVALHMMRLYHGEALEPSELRECERAAAKAGVPKAAIAGLGWRCAENGGPGSMSVILEAQARIRGQASAIDSRLDDLVAVRVLRELIFERNPLASDLVVYLTAILGADKQDYAFLLRFARDVLAETGSPLQVVVLKQLLLGRGCAAWSETNLAPEEQLALVEQLVDDIECGAPPKVPPPPSADDVAEGAKMLKAALADTHINEREAKRIFAHFDRDGSGVLDSREVEAAVFHLIREARDAMVAKELDDDKRYELARGFKAILRHYQSPEGTAEFMASFDPSGDGQVEESEFLAHLPAFVAEMMGADTPSTGSSSTSQPNFEAAPSFDPEHSGPAVGSFDNESVKQNAATKLETPRKAEKLHHTKSRDQEVRRELQDSDDSDGEEGDGQASPRSQKGGLAAPKGFLEYFRYLAVPGGAAPRGLAGVLYMCVEKHLPVSVSLSIQHLLVGAELDAEDCANLLAFLSRGVQTDNRKQLTSAAKEYSKLTAAAWAQSKWSSSTRSDTKVDSTDSSDPTVVAIQEPIGAGNAVAVTTGGSSMSPKDVLLRMARGVSQIDAANVAELYALASQVLAGSKLFRGGPETIGNSGLESLLDGHWPRESGTSTAQSTKVPSVVTQPADTSLADIKFINPLDTLEDGEDEGGDMDQGISDTPASDEPQSLVSATPPESGEDGGSKSQDTVQQVAEEFEPEYIKSADLSLVQLLGFQSRDPCTVSAFQTLVSRRALSEQEMQALHTMAEAAAIDSAIIDTLVWLWNGGDAANDDVLREMIEPAERGTLTDIKPPEKGILQFTCVKATGLLAKDGPLGKSDPFCSVRVEGHARITQTISKNLDPEWEADDPDAATFTFRVVNRNIATVEVHLYDQDRGDKAEELGCVTFPLNIIDTGVEMEQEFVIEPTRGMPQHRGEANLGKITLRMMFEKSSAQFEIPQMETSQAVESLITAADERSMNHTVQLLLREAAAIVIARTKQDLETTPSETDPKAVEKPDFAGMSRKEKKAAKTKLKEKQKKALESLPKGLQITGKVDPHKPTLEQLQQESKVKKSEKKEVLGKKVALIDIAYREDTDKEMEAALLRPMRAKYLTAIAYALGKFLNINPAILNAIEDTINKFDPAPEVTGAFAAAFLGTLGIDETPQRKELVLIKRFLPDRLNEEIDKLVRSSKTNKAWFRQLQKMCRGGGCSAGSVNYASEIVGEADSFSTAGALYRIAKGLGAAEPEELAELDRLVEENQSEEADFIKAGVQNLQKMIWPTREATFDKVRELLAGSELAERGLAGWENRAELRSILRGDERALQALEGLFQMENFRAYLTLKSKDLELIALNKVMAGDKAAEAVLRTLTPSFGEKITQEWENASRLTKAKTIFIALCAALMLLSKLVKPLLVGTPVGVAITFVLDLIFLLVALFGGLLLAVYFIFKGKPYRDKVVGPDPLGVALLQKVASAELDNDLKKKGSSALQLLLMGQKPDAEGLTYLRSIVQKYHEKVPASKHALDCMENILILQAAGKETAKIDEYAAKLEWPTKNDIWPPSKMKWRDAYDRVKEKTKRFFFKASIHPWMKKYATSADDIDKLYEVVEVPLSMMQDNAEEFAALEKLRKGYRPDPGGLATLVAVVDELNNINSKKGPHATTLQQAMQENCRTGKTKEVFAALDEDESGFLSQDEFDKATEMLGSQVGFKISGDELDAAFKKMDNSGDGQVDLREFEKWWKSVCMSKKQLKALKQEQMVSAGLLEKSPGPKQLKAQLAVITKLAPTIGMSTRCFETLEDMCADDATFDLLQECFYLCELKRAMINDKEAFKAIVGLEAVCMVPLLLQGNEKLGIPANPKAMKLLQDVKLGDKGALGALAYMRQPEWRRYWGMLTQRMRRLVFCVGAAVGYPMLVATGIVDAGDMNMSSIAGDLANMVVADASTSGSWEDDDSGEALNATYGAANSTSTAMGDFTNPSFYVLGLIPLASSLFVTLFGQRIASVITLGTVFVSAAGATISAALNDGTDEFTPSKFIGICSGLFAGGTALKVASGNVKFAYGVQGASIGAVVSRVSVNIWRPRLLWLIPELEPYLGWVDMSAGVAFGAGAAWISNAYRNIISIFATAAMGTLGFVQTSAAYGVPGMDNWTIENLASGGIQCTNDSCWAAGVVVLTSLWGGTMNQFKMESMDFSVPAVTAYERLLASVDKAMALLFAINEFIDKADHLDTSELMEQCLAARDSMSQYAALVTNAMQFSLCFGFVGDFLIQLNAGVFDAVPWVGVTSLAMAFVTPVMAAIGTLASAFTQPQLINRLLEIKVPPFVSKKFPDVFPIGRESFVIKFGPIGRYLQKLSFYICMTNSFISVLIVGVSWLTAEMYCLRYTALKSIRRLLCRWIDRIKVRAEWETLSLSMPGVSLEDAMDRVAGSVSSLGDSAAGLLTILGASITATAYDVGGKNWLLVHAVEMEHYFVIGAGGVISGTGVKLGLDYPAGMFMFGPLGLVGGATMVFGVLKAIPWFEQRFPDIMHTLHKLQLAVCAFLGVMFFVIIGYARSAQDFVDQNWNGCYYPTVCELVGENDWSMQEYAATLNVDRVGMEGILRPMLYASSVSCLSCLVLLAGGSNFAKYTYYMTVLSRREEIAAAKATGNDAGSVRRDALTKKVRGQRQADIKAAALAMQRSKVTNLEEAALVMEFATGVSMEQHYDLTMHDEIMVDIQKCSAVEAQATAVMDSRSLPGGMGIEVPSTVGAASSPLDGLSGEIGSNTRATSGAAPLLSDDLDLANAKRALEAGGLSADAAKQQLQETAGMVSDFAATTADEVRGKGQAMQAKGLGMGVKDTGSSLATLARALVDDGVRTDFHDAREDEKISLKSRVKGAKELLAKTKDQNLAGWSELDIHAKRTKMYTQMNQEVEAGSMLPSLALSSIFQKRV